MSFFFFFLQCAFVCSHMWRWCVNILEEFHQRLVEGIFTQTEGEEKNRRWERAGERFGRSHGLVWDLQGNRIIRMYIVVGGCLLQELTHVMKEAEKSRHAPSASWKPWKAGGVTQSQSSALRSRRANVWGLEKMGVPDPAENKFTLFCLFVYSGPQPIGYCPPTPVWLYQVLWFEY